LIGDDNVIEGNASLASKPARLETLARIRARPASFRRLPSGGVGLVRAALHTLQQLP
jgi:hypothetical protein